MRLVERNYIPKDKVDGMSISTSIDLSRCRLKIIDNHISKKTIDSLWNFYGSENSILVNGPFFNMSTREPLVHMKIDGQVINKPAYQEYGIAWNEGEPPVWTILPAPYYENYFTNTVVIPNGTPRVNISSHPDADGTKQKPRYANRPAFGFSGDRFEFCIEDRVSLWGLQDKLVKRFWQRALVGDGGASVAYRDSYKRIKPGRTIPYWILITVLEDEPKGEKPMVEINAYSLKKDGSKQLTKNFKVREFACKDGTDTIFVAPALVDILQKIRDHFGKPVVINSAYRHDKYNKTIGGATYSQHLYGSAADIHIQGVDPKELYAYTDSIMKKTGGLGIYSWGIHVDVRGGVMARWNG